MSKMTEIIEAFVDNKETVSVYIPGKDFQLCKVESINDDVVTVKPNNGDKIVLHYTQFVVERD